MNNDPRLDPALGDRRLILAVDEFELIETGIRDGTIDARVREYLRSLNARVVSWVVVDPRVSA